VIAVWINWQLAHDAKVRAPGDALSLITRIKQLQTSAEDA